MTPSMKILTKSAFSRSRVPAAAHLDGLAEIGQAPCRAACGTARGRAPSSPSARVDLVQQFELVEIAVHVVEAGDAERGAIGEARRRMSLSTARWAAVGGVFGSWPIRPSISRPPVGVRSVIGAKPSNSRNSPVASPSIAHHDLAARRRVVAVQDAGRLQRRGVRPHRMVVAREQAPAAGPAGCGRASGG